MAQPAKPAGSVFDNTNPAHEAELDAQAEADIKAGRTVDDEVAREWLRALARGDVLPPPQN